MRVLTCDQCHSEVEEPIEVTYYREDEDGDPCFAEAHFCGWQCLAAWAMAEALDHTA